MAIKIFEMLVNYNLVSRPDVCEGLMECLDKLTHKTSEHVTGSHMTFCVQIQSSQLSRIARETHAFYAKLTLTRFVSSQSRISS